MIALALAWVLCVPQEPHTVDEELARVLTEEVRGWISGTPPDAGALAALRAEAATLAAPALVRELGRLAHRLAELGRAEEARELVHWCGERALLLEDRATASWAHEWLGQHAWVRGELEEARAELRAAAELDAERGAVLDEVRHRADVARIALTLGRHGEALEEVRATSTRARQAGSDAAVRAAVEVEASLLYELGRHRAALELIQAHAALDAHEYAHDEFQVRLDLLAAGVLADIGRLETAEGYARRAHEVACEAGVVRIAPLLQLEAKLVLGLLLGDLARPEEGLARLAEAAQEFERLDDPRGVAWAAKNRGFVLLAAGRAEEAVFAFDLAQALGGKLGVPYLEALGALGRAEAMAELEPLDARIEVLLGRAEELGRSLGERQILWRVAALRGRRALLRGEPDSALKELRVAVEAIEAWRRTLAAGGLLEHALTARADVYRDAVLAAARCGSAEEALALAGLLQARLLDELGARRDGALPPTRGAELEELRVRVGELEALGEHAEPGALAAAWEALDRRLLADDLARGRVLAGGTRTVPLAELRAGLAAERLDVALVYVLGPRGGVVLCLDADPTRPLRSVPLELTRDEVVALVQRLRTPFELLESGEVDLAHLDFDVAAARELHDRLVAPLGLDDGLRVALLLDEALAPLPFEALVNGGAPGAFDPVRPGAHLSGLRLLGDSQAFVRVASLARLAHPQPPRGHGPLVHLADALALPGAQGEAGRFAELMPGLMERSGASVAELQHALTTAARVHVSAHGELDPARPAHGALRLGDGPFAAWRAAELELAGLEVVLAACHSGRGAWRAGAGLAGLIGGFLQGGAREVVASQWAVDDHASREFFAAYHAARAQGRDAPAALLEARRELRARFPHPYHRTAWFVQR